ncbi:uncharacterized protein EAF02_000136 [Botrytis sinoallii]|uniref:uncharacterized protein n=1 Tax=Botrytis sinoallii TaxID=1463999 RepID=UPI0018FFCB1D|nr:uncharacterized protein EAF02_000136 [Botrytis sinoallii]KAF7892598.1 hypothetical protein EAF02_000136 [Botrytis sinoallii]
MASALDEMSITEKNHIKRKSWRMVGLAFLCAFAVPKDTSLREITGGSSHASNVKASVFDLNAIEVDYNINTDYQDSFLPARNARQKYYHDLNDTMARDYEAKLKLQIVAGSLTKATSAARLMIPPVYLIREDDRVTPVSLQEIMIAAQTLGRVMNEERVFCGHNSSFKSPGCTAGFSRRAAGEEFDAAETWISLILKLAHTQGNLQYCASKKNTKD